MSATPEGWWPECKGNASKATTQPEQATQAPLRLYRCVATVPLPARHWMHLLALENWLPSHICTRRIPAEGVLTCMPGGACASMGAQRSKKAGGPEGQGEVRDCGAQRCEER